MADCKLEQRVYCKIHSKLCFFATDIQEDLQKVYEVNVLQYGAVAKGSVDLKTGTSLLKMMREPGTLPQPPPKRKLIS